MREMPAAERAAISAAESTRPFLKVAAPVRTEWTRIAPSAVATSVSPKIMS
jgi:hypothetical protein